MNSDRRHSPDTPCPRLLSVRAPASPGRGFLFAPPGSRLATENNYQEQRFTLRNGILLIRHPLTPRTMRESAVMDEQQPKTMPEDVRQSFEEAVRLYNRWQFGTPVPTLHFRNLIVSISGVCDLVLAYKNEPLALPVYDELWGLIDDLHQNLREELALDPSCATGARCLDTLIQDRRAAISIAQALSVQAQA